MTLSFAVLKDDSFVIRLKSSD